MLTDVFEINPEMNNDFDETAQSCSLDGPIQDAEPVEKVSDFTFESTNIYKYLCSVLSKKILIF